MTQVFLAPHPREIGTRRAAAPRMIQEAEEIVGEAEEARIRDVWDRLAQAWSSADLGGVVSAWDVESDHRRIGTPARPDSLGREHLERSLSAAFSRRQHAGRRHLSCRIGSVRFLRADVAIVDGILQVTAPGTAKPALTEPVTAVMTKRGGDWVIAASRVTAPHRANARI